MPNLPEKLETGNYTDQRPTRWYHTKAWKTRRKRYLVDHPLCECDECKSLGRRMTASVVHHKIPHHNTSERLFWDEDNWQAMSEPCHNKHTATHERR